MDYPTDLTGRQGGIVVYKTLTEANFVMKENKCKALIGDARGNKSGLVVWTFG
jgi:hypothetical protein